MGQRDFLPCKRDYSGRCVRSLAAESSVLHVVEWDRSPDEFILGDLVKLEINPDRFSDLCKFIHQTYELDKDKNAQDLGPGIYGESRFFRAKGLYYFPNTCNMWTANSPENCRSPNCAGTLFHRESRADLCAPCWDGRAHSTILNFCILRLGKHPKRSLQCLK